MTARELLDELCRRIYGDRPPEVSTTIVIRERENHSPNWVAASSTTVDVEAEMYTADVIELRKTDPIVDWSGVRARGPKPRTVFNIIAGQPA